MSEPLFQRHGRSLTLPEIVALTGARTPVERMPERTIDDAATLDRAGPNAIAMLDREADAGSAKASHAGACLTTEALAGALPPRVAPLIVDDPLRAFVEVARALFPNARRPSSLTESGSAAGAQVDASARIESGVTIEPGVVVGPQAEIGNGTILGANAVIGPEVRIGRDCTIGKGAIISDALIGDRVVIHRGCNIGQRGFADAAAEGTMPRVGRVIIQDGVEIGAGTSIDRGALGDTVIGEGSKIDNLVQVGQNVSIGRHCIVVAQTGISASATLEDYVVLGARVSLDSNVTIGEGARVAAATAVRDDVQARQSGG